MNIEEKMRKWAEGIETDSVRVEMSIADFKAIVSEMQRLRQSYSLGLARAAEIVAEFEKTGMPTRNSFIKAIRAEAAAPAVCEWVATPKGLGFDHAHGRNYTHSHEVHSFKFCPYCGKPIAVKEGE